MTCPNGCGPRPLDTFTGATSKRLLHWCEVCSTVWAGEARHALAPLLSATQSWGCVPALPAAPPAETVHGAFIEHMQLARRMAESTGRHVTDAEVLRLTRKYTLGALRQLFGLTGSTTAA